MNFLGTVISICCFVSAFLVGMFQLLLQIDGYMYVYAQVLAFIGAIGALISNENVGFSLNISLIIMIALLWFAVDYIFVF